MNNRGVALLEQFDYTEAVRTFRRALEIDPQLGLAHTNLSIGLYYAADIDGALREAQAAVRLTPTAPQPHYLLGLIAKSQNRVDEAIAEFQRVRAIDPHDVGTQISLGQLYLQQRKYAEAIEILRAAVDEEPFNVTAAYNLGVSLMRAGRRDEGQRMMERLQTLRASGYGTTFSQAYLGQGRYAEALASTGAEADLVDPATPNVAFTDVTETMMRADAGRAPRKARVAPPALGRRLARGELTAAVPLLSSARRQLAAGLGGSLTLFDYDGDGDLDLFEITPFGQRLYRNDGGTFVDVTEHSGLATGSRGGAPTGTGAVAGDYDSDGKPDLLVLRDGGIALYHNDGNGKFSDVTAASGLPAYPYLARAAALVDVDHDGDLDIVIAGLADLARPQPAAGSPPDSARGTETPRRSRLRGAPDRGLTFPDDFSPAPTVLLRNNGNGTFTNITASAQLSAPPTHAVAIVPTDFDNRRDVDLLVLGYTEGPVLFKNMRDGTFRNVAREVGLTPHGRFSCVAAADVNKDGYTDFFFGRAAAPGVFAMSDGRGRFVLAAAPAETADASAAHFLDYDNDGLLDLVTVSAHGAHVLRNLGDGWADVSERALGRRLRGPHPGAGQHAMGAPSPSARQDEVTVLASGDLEGDGDTDLLVRSATGPTRYWRNDGGSRNRSVRVRLTGRVSNRNAVGAKVEVRAGSLAQKLETAAVTPTGAPADLLFGLGPRPAADVVRILWPSGILQAEIAPGASTAAETRSGGRAAVTDKARAGEPGLVTTWNITELDRKPSSCPYLYTWNGRRFEFVTDFMGGGELGYWVAPGERNVPDPDEYVRIRGDQLHPRNGRYELRVTNELEEALFIDRLQLVALAHPAGVEVFPNEGLLDPPRPPFRLYATRGAYPPVSAHDDHGHDVRSRIARIDRVYPDDFRAYPIRGYAEEHTLTLDLGAPRSGRTLLMLTGWTDYAFSSDNVAAHQQGLRLMPPALEVRDATGGWRTVVPDIGIPVGRPQTVVVDLTAKFLTRSREVRIRTNMRVYWDQILVDTSGGAYPIEMHRLEPVTAELRWRGFSVETTPDGREPFVYDYGRVSFTSPWKVPPGRYTREGDVRALLRHTDDQFVVARPGDELAVSFDATALPPLASGWKRAFLLYVNGFSKEMDLHSASPDRVEPLPFHGMMRYPYSPPESYPATPAHRAYLDRYNTRVVHAPVPSIDAVLLEATMRRGRVKENVMSSALSGARSSIQRIAGERK